MISYTFIFLDSWTQVLITYFAEHLSKFVFKIFDIPFTSMDLETHKQTPEGLRDYETLVDFAW